MEKEAQTQAHCRGTLAHAARTNLQELVDRGYDRELVEVCGGRKAAKILRQNLERKEGE